MHDLLVLLPILQVPDSCPRKFRNSIMPHFAQSNTAILPKSQTVFRHLHALSYLTCCTPV